MTHFHLYVLEFETKIKH